MTERRDTPARIFETCVREPHIWTWLFSNRVASVLVWLIARCDRITPNHVTVLGFLVGLAAAGAVAATPSDSLVQVLLCVALVETYLILDCTDGQLARYTRRTSPRGALLDSILDRAIYVALFTAAAWREAAQSGSPTWFVVSAVAVGAILIVHPVYPPGARRPAGSDPRANGPARRAFEAAVRVLGTAQAFFWLSVSLLAGAVGVWLAVYAFFYLLRLAGRLVAPLQTPSSD